METKKDIRLIVTFQALDYFCGPKNLAQKWVTEVISYSSTVGEVEEALKIIIPQVELVTPPETN